MGARVGVAVIAVLLALYIVFVGQRAVILLTSGDVVAVLMGVALIVFPALAVWALVRGRGPLETLLAVVTRWVLRR